MWKGEKYKQMIPKLQEHPLIGEIIIVNNDISVTNTNLLQLSKVVHLPQHQNIYVNPAWNLGVKTAKFDKLCILNDDVEFDCNQIIDMVYPYIKPEVGIIGFSGETIFDDVTPNLYEEYQVQSKCIVRCNVMHPKYGICMFIHKESYTEIPTEYKIWFGDNHLYNHTISTGKMNYMIRGKDIKIYTKMSSTVRDPSTITEVSRIVDADSLAYKANNPHEVMLEEIMRFQNLPK